MNRVIEWNQGPSLPYSCPQWTDEEVTALAEVVRSGWWTAGPRTAQFEAALRETTGARNAVCVTNGTAAIHAILHNVRPKGARALFVTSALNFAAGPSVAAQLGWDLAFTDVEAESLNMSTNSLAEVLATAVHDHDIVLVMPVHFAGLPVDVNAVSTLAKAHGAIVLEDACHALPARYPSNSRARVFSRFFA